MDVVSAAGAHRETFIAMRCGLHHNLMVALQFGGERAGIRGRGRLVSDHVLIADVVRNLLRDGVHLAEVRGEKCRPARLLGENAQGPARLLLLLMPQQSNAVDGRAAVNGDVPHRLLQRVVAGRVFAIGHHQDDLLLQLRGPHQMVVGGHQRVDQGEVRVPGQDRAEVHLLEERVAVADPGPRHDLEPDHLLGRAPPAVRLDEGRYHVRAAGQAAVALAEHPDGLADPRGRAQGDP